MVFKALFIAVLCTELVNGLAYEAPIATQHSREKENGWTPMPTSAPRNPHDLIKRQSITDIFSSTILQGSDATCGYLSGNPGAPYTCGVGATCNFWPGAQSSIRGVVACCLNRSCYPRAACVNSRDFSSRCNDVCDADIYTLKCTAASAPYCNTAVWADINVREVYCSSRTVSTTQTFYTTYDGQVSGGKFTPLALDSLISSSSTSSRRSSTTRSSTTSDSDSSTSSRSSSTASTTGSGLPAIFPVPNPDPPKAATPIGAIVGGAIGGVALLALIGLAIFMIRRRGRRGTTAAGSPPLVVPVVHTDSHNQAPPPLYHQNNATPLPPQTSEMDGAGKPPPMASVSEHGYFAPAPLPKPYGDANQYQYNSNELSGAGGEARRTSAVSPISPPPQFNGGSTVSGGSPQPSGRESYVSSGYETYPSYPPPGAHEMPGNEVRRQ